MLDGLVELAEVDREADFLGRGGTSSAVWLNRFTRSFSDVWRFLDAPGAVELGFAVAIGECSVEED